MGFVKQVILALLLCLFLSASTAQAAVASFHVNLYKDNNGEPGELITDDTVQVGESFFLEIMARENDPARAGLAGVALDIAWDPDVLEEIDDPPDLIHTITEHLPLFRGGVVDNELGTIDDLTGYAFLAGSAGRAIGNRRAERFCLLRFRALGQPGSTLISMRQGKTAIATVPVSSLSSAHLYFEPQTITVSAQSANSCVLMRLDYTDAQGAVIDQVNVDDEFLVNLYVRDIRERPFGVAYAFLDLTYDPALASPAGSFSYGSEYPEFPSGSTDNPGELDEVGAVGKISPPEHADADFLLFSLPMRAEAAGVLEFSANAADGLGNWVGLWHSLTGPCDWENVVFTSSRLTITGTAALKPWTNPQSAYDVNDDGRANPLDALIILDKLQSDGGGQLLAPTAGNAPPPYYDVNGDGSVSPLDVLWIFEFLVNGGG